MITILIFVIIGIILKFIINKTNHQLDNAPIIIYVLFGLLWGIVTGVIIGSLLKDSNTTKDIVSTYNISKFDDNSSLCECGVYVERVNFDYIVNINNEKTIISTLSARIIQSNNDTPKIIKYMIQQSEDDWTYWFTVGSTISPRIEYDIFIPLGSDIKYLSNL